MSKTLNFDGSKTLNFFDFDGSLIDSALPDPGKKIWSEFYGKPYPHIGWWSKPESLDTKVFKCEPREVAYNAYLDYEELLDTYNYILTSRIPKLKQELAEVLSINGIIMDDILCAKDNLTKGQRILEVIATHTNKGETVAMINVWEDRNKEIVTIEAERSIIEGMGITLNVFKIQSDATD